MSPSVNLIDKVVKTMVVPEKVKNPEKRVLVLEESIRAVRTSLREGHFFAFEAVSESAEEEIQKRQAEINHLRMSMEGFPELDYSFLAWRKKNTKLPAFMVVDLNTNTFTLTVSPLESDSGRLDLEDSGFDFRPDLPGEIADQYMESINYLLRLAVKSHDWADIQIEAEYRGGVMPDDLRVRIRDVQERRLFDKIFIVAEAPAWKIDAIARTKGDPLVVGWSRDTAQMFLIGAFDPTPLEKYVEEQFIK